MFYSTPYQSVGNAFHSLVFAVYLQVINVFLSIKIDALGFLLNGHDREAHVNAAMQFPFLNLQDKVNTQCHEYFGLELIQLRRDAVLF